LKPYVPKSLSTASHVWLRNFSDSSLQPRYTGPYKLLEIRQNYARVLINDSIQSISLTRLKPAFGISTEESIKLLNDHPSTHISTEQYPIQKISPSILPPTSTVPNDTDTRNLISQEQRIPHTILRRVPNVSVNGHTHNTRFKHATFNNWVSIRTIDAPPSTPTRLHKIFQL